MFTDEPMQKQNVIYMNLWAIFLGTKLLIATELYT